MNDIEATIHLDVHIIYEARQLRALFMHRLEQLGSFNRAEYLRHMAELLNCNNPSFQLYHPEEELGYPQPGVEDHVLQHLRKLNGPHGYTYYRYLLITTGKEHLKFETPVVPNVGGK